MRFIMSITLAGMLAAGCSSTPEQSQEAGKDDFKYLLEQFSDVKILRYKIPGFEDLSLQEKELIYYLSEASLCGRDIMFDQNYKHNLSIRRTNEAIINSYQGDKNTDEYKQFMIYAKRVWFSNGIHHHYATDKFVPEISESYYAELIKNSDASLLPVLDGENTEAFIQRITPIVFNDEFENKKICLDGSKDIITNSAVNFYEGVNQQEVEALYGAYKQEDPNRPVAIGINSKVIKENGQVSEKTYKIDGMYGGAIEKIVYWLEKAEKVADSPEQKVAIGQLIEYYKTGDLKIWDDFNVSWVQDLNADVDFVNGFIETYDDPMSMKAAWEAIVNFKNHEATKRTTIISDNAQWFEDNSPVDKRFKKEEVKGVSAKVITLAQLGGACYPTTPIGINLPNSDWIRKDFGSKSVTIENITDAYNKAAQGNGFLEEFMYSEEAIKRAKEFGSLAGNLHTDLHECLGHGSGQLLPTTSSEALKNYSSALEEARADLFALYYIGDEKMVELGLIPSLEVAWAEYDSYMMNGFMTQLTRIKPGKDIEQAHMRNRQLVTTWCYEKGKADNIVELKEKDGKHYIVINDYQKLRGLFGTLLAEIQRIKSEGDFEAGKAMVERYAVKVNQEIHKEVLARYEKLKIAPYSGFINPRLVPVYEGEKLVDVKVEYPADYTKQMLRYSKEYSFLPNYN